MPSSTDDIGAHDVGGVAIAPVLGDTRAAMGETFVNKPFALRSIHSAARKSRAYCPVPLTRPATRASSRSEHSGTSQEEQEISRSSGQMGQMLDGRAECEDCMNRVTKLIRDDQRMEAKQVMHLINSYSPPWAAREWNLLQDRHSRSKQDLWALRRELKTVQHKVTTSSRELRKRIADCRPSTASPSLFGSYSGVLGGAMVKKVERGQRGFGDPLLSFASSVAMAKFTEESIDLFKRRAQAIYAQHLKGKETHQAEIRAKLNSPSRCTTPA